ncbi:MAG: hypothetical protein H6Q77_2093 [Gemmatimonadetes bacterium]|nr:hypothetical protein [Gemmatimonadota bacterium]
MLHAQHPGRVRALHERRPSPAEVHAQGHHHGLAQRVDRGVGDLGEALPEVGICALRRAGERRDRGVVAHAPDGVHAGRRHGLDHQAQVFETIAEKPLPNDQLVAGRGRKRADRIGHQHRHVPADPRFVRMPARHLALRVEVADDLAAHEIGDQHLARPDLAGLDDFLGLEIHEAHFRAHHEQPVVPDLVATGAEPVAVHRRAREPPVGIGQGGGTIPRLVEDLVILVEGTDRGVDVGILLPGLRDHHHRRVHRVATRAHEQFHRIVQARGVAAMRPDDVLEPVLASFPEG